MKLAKRALLKFQKKLKKNIEFAISREQKEKLEKYLVGKATLFHEVEIVKNTNCIVFLFADNSAIKVCNEKHLTTHWLTLVSYHNNYNSHKVNYGFPIDSEKEDFVAGAVIEVMYDDSPPRTCLILVSGETNNYKGDITFKVLCVDDNSVQTITQMQIKTLVCKNEEILNFGENE
jgi:hypothetical protein